MLSNTQIDSFFKRCMVPSGGRLKYIRADSYQTFISPDGHDNILRNYGVTDWFGIVNLDTKYGMGTHWVALMNTRDLTVYIDPLGGKYYRLPIPIKKFLKARGVFPNGVAPQGKTISDEYGKTSPDTYCGAYAIGLLLPYLIQRNMIRHNYVSELRNIFGITDDPESAKKILSADAIVDDFARYVKRS